MDYQGIDLAPYVGWYVLCRNARCRRVLGKVDANRDGFTLAVGAVVAPAGSNGIIKLPRLRKPMTTEKAEMTELPTGAFGGWGVDDAATLTRLPITSRVECPERGCHQVLSLAHLSRADLQAQRR